MAGTEPAREMPVLPGMIEVIVGITRAGIVSDPPAVGVNVGRVWMPRFVAIAAEFPVVRGATSHFRRTATWNVSTTEAMHTAATMLPTATASVFCIGGDRTRQRKGEKSDY
jgi:hypothetical protein